MGTDRNTHYATCGRCEDSFVESQGHQCSGSRDQWSHSSPGGAFAVIGRIVLFPFVALLALTVILFVLCLILIPILVGLIVFLQLQNL